MKEYKSTYKPIVKYKEPGYKHEDYTYPPMPEIPPYPTKVYTPAYETVPTYKEPDYKPVDYTYPSGPKNPHYYTNQYKPAYVPEVKYEKPAYKYVDYSNPPEPKYKVRIRTRQDFSCCPSDVMFCDVFKEECLDLMEKGNMVNCSKTSRFT